ncbi:MAG: phage gp6-like head-tail connector protein, partial [Novosphingobium sp.]|nr:phage gp6-like head-tail connector protein [Novosphingobium sp.]
MKRAIVTPASLPPSALAELKQWLGISTAHDDALLFGLLEAALDICEAFTGLMPLEVEAEEILPASGDWQTLATQPIQSIHLVQAIGSIGER